MTTYYLITKIESTDGHIFRIEADPAPTQYRPGYVQVIDRKTKNKFLLGRDCFADRNEAIEAAKKRRSTLIDWAKNRAARLEALEISCD